MLRPDYRISNGTPTLLLDGRKLTDDETFTSTGLRAALEEAFK